jgi:hypothetical protein
MSGWGAYPRFRAPQGDREVLCVPSAEQLPGLIAAARQRIVDADWLGEPLGDLAKSARAEILTVAAKWTRSYADVPNDAEPEAPLVLTGHQPELFHPGVWLKNFFAARLAASCGGTAINLIVDSDLCRSPAIRVPGGSDSDLRFESIAYDQTLSEMPYEERRIADADLWQSFGERVTAAMKPFVAEPLVADWWPRVVAEGERDQSLGGAISRARHQLENAWGSASLEVPQSHVCGTRAFRLFVVGMLSRAEEFRAAYNDSLGEYRAAHHLKNHAQPVPNLAVHDDWVETPFWLWSKNDPQRRGVFVRRVGSELDVSDQQDFRAKLPVDHALAVEQLAAWESQGIKLRSRALATTLFARLFLADVFIHGIGGAKYDQVTNRTCERFLGMALPPYATITGTLRLPLAQPASELKQVPDMQRELRELQFQPERHRGKMQLSTKDAERVERVIDEKLSWVHIAKSLENAAERHQAITSANHELSAFLNNRRDILESEILAARHAANVAKIRNSREFAYCLFPSQELQQFFGCKNLAAT